MNRILSSGLACLFIWSVTASFVGFSEKAGTSLFAEAKDVEKVPELDLAKMINDKERHVSDCLSSGLAVRFLSWAGTGMFSLMFHINPDSKIFVRKREEHKLLVNHLQSIDDYAKRYKLMKLGIDEIIRLIREEGGKLRGNNITAESEFPKIQELINALAQYLENICLFGEMVLHFPDMAYRILKPVSDWRELMTQALVYSRSFTHILDDKSIEMLGLLNQEINEDQRTDSYVNPYREAAQAATADGVATKKKSKTKPKKGPAMTPPKTEL